MKNRTALIISMLLISSMLFIPTGYIVLSDSKLFNSVPRNKHLEQPSGLGVYLINLDRSKQRLAFVQPKIEELGLPWERIAAVDGVKLSQTDLRRNVDIKSYSNYLGNNPRLGTIGCALSHIEFWQKFLESDYEYALVFEDDISFEPAKLKIAINNILKHAKLWDIVSLEVHHRGMPLTAKRFSDDMRMVVYLTNVSHTGAYIINRTAAERLLQKSLPIKMPVDHYFSRAWEFDLKFVGIEPRLVIQSYGDSEIEATKRNAELSRTPLQKIYQAVYAAQSSIIRFAYNLKVYLTIS